MIEANELRIGNWVLYPHTQHELFKIELPRHIELAYLLKPITLTPEILEKCGAVKLESLPFYEIDLKKNIGQINVNPNNGVLWLRHHRNPQTGLNPMFDNYLHQLQNLYFSLTGEELPINL